MLIERAELEPGAPPRDVRIVRERVAEIGDALAVSASEPRVDAGGGALLPGLHDHHLHLFALAAAERSAACGPPDVEDRAALARALAAAEPESGSSWIRGVGYHESVAGVLDRAALDRLSPAGPVRIQHRSGALWILDSRAVDALDLDGGVDAAGVERDAAGRATGRLFDLDAWLRERLPRARPPDLASSGRRLASYGVTGVTDATATNGGQALEALASAVQSGALPQRVLAMGSEELPASPHPRIERGAVKIYLAERSLPAIDALAERVRAAHEAGRAVAFHCVTRAELVIACAATDAAGARAGDRIEHAGVAPPDVLPLLARLGLAVVTQPGFVHERGDAYLAEVDPIDRPWLYRAAGLLAAGIALGGATDAPFGHPDPWRAMRAAVDRRTRAGVDLGTDERLSPEQALALFTTPSAAPGGRPRRVAVGEPADLCLLDRPWGEARRALSSERVRMTIRGGELIFSKEP